MVLSEGWHRLEERATLSCCLGDLAMFFFHPTRSRTCSRIVFIWDRSGKEAAEISEVFESSGDSRDV